MRSIHKSQFFIALQVAAVCSFVAIGSQALFAQDAPAPAGAEPATGETEPRPLAAEPWSEKAYGISLRPPVQTTLLSQKGSPFLCEMVDLGKRFKIMVSVTRYTAKTQVDLERMNKELNPTTVAELAIQRINELQGITLSIREHEVDAERRYDGRPAVTMYYTAPPPVAAKRQLPAGAREITRIETLPDGRQRSDTAPAIMFFGKTYIRIKQDLWALVEVEGLEEDMASLRQTYEALLNSVRITDAKELEEKRHKAVQLLIDWRKGITAEHLYESLVPEQYFILLRSEPGREPRPVGWMEVVQAKTKRLEKEGIVVKVSSFVRDGQSSQNLEAEYFMAADEEYEDWRVRSILRQPRENAVLRPGDDPIEVTKAQLNGFRTKQQVVVALVMPVAKELRFEISEETYLSQVYRWLLPQLIRADQPGEYGYYFFDELEAKIAFRTDVVQPLPGNRGIGILTTEHPNREPIRTRYSSDRKLTEHRLGPTLRYIPSSVRELHRLFPTGRSQ